MVGYFPYEKRKDSTRDLPTEVSGKPNVATDTNDTVGTADTDNLSG